MWDTRRGRSPLERLDEFCAHDDAALRGGRDLPPQVLNDDQVGRVVARLDAPGTLTRVTAGAVGAERLVGMEKPEVHVDTTAQSGDGAYRPGDGPEGPCRLTHGESQEKRPARKPGGCSRRGGDRAGPLGGPAEEGQAADQPRQTTVWSALAPRCATHGVAPGA